MPLCVSFAGERPGPLPTIRVEPARAVSAIGSLLNVAHQTPTPPAEIDMGLKTRDQSGPEARDLSGPDWPGSRSMPWGRLETDFPAPRLLALVEVLFQPSLDGLTTVPHVTAHSVADWAVALVPPAVQGVNGNAQHFRDIRKRHQLVTGPECHDHRPFVDGQSGGIFGAPSQRCDLGAVSGPLDGCGLATVKDLSREATAGGRRATRIEVA